MPILNGGQNKEKNMTQKIKAIQTFYKGRNFRSRLEARWAVFFDTAKIDFLYEPEGFDLGEGLFYLPDFYIPDEDIFVEVKPRKLNETERKKALLLSKHSKKPVINLSVIPDYNGLDCLFPYGYYGTTIKSLLMSDNICFYLWKTGLSEQDKYGENMKKLLLYDDYEYSNIAEKALAFDLDYYFKKYGCNHPSHFNEGMVHDGFEFFRNENMAKSLLAAKQARFEHGECG
jgi:hypothetical protein